MVNGVMIKIKRIAVLSKRKIIAYSCAMKIWGGKPEEKASEIIKKFIPQVQYHTKFTVRIND